MTAATKSVVQIKPANIQTAVFKINGTAPYVQARFSAKAMQAMRAKMLEGSTAKGKKVREARDFEDDFEQAKHISTEVIPGIRGLVCFPINSFNPV